MLKSWFVCGFADLVYMQLDLDNLKMGSGNRFYGDNLGAFGLWGSWVGEPSLGVLFSCSGLMQKNWFVCGF